MLVIVPMVNDFERQSPEATLLTNIAFATFLLNIRVSLVLVGCPTFPRLCALYSYLRNVNSSLIVQ